MERREGKPEWPKPSLLPPFTLLLQYSASQSFVPTLFTMASIPYEFHPHSSALPIHCPEPALVLFQFLEHTKPLATFLYSTFPQRPSLCLGNPSYCPSENGLLRGLQSFLEKRGAFPPPEGILLS